MSVTSSADTTRVEVCYLPPFEWNPTLPRARELLSVIRDSSTFAILYQFNATHGCFAAPSTPNTCATVQIASSTQCTDAQLFVETDRLEFGLNKVLGLSSSDNGVSWSQIANDVSSMLSSLNVANQMGDNLNAKADLLDNISDRGSSILSMLNSLFASNYGTLGRYTTNSLVNTAYWRALASAEAAQVLADVSTSATQVSLDSPASLRLYDDKWRKLLAFTPNLALRVLGSALSNFSSIATSISDASPFLPSNITRIIDAVTADYYQLASSTLSAIPASTFGQTHRACYATKLQKVAQVFNFSRLLSGNNNIICSATIMQQEYDLFSAKFADECFYALADDYFHQANSSASTIIFNFLNITDQQSQLNSSIASVDRFGKFKFTAFPRIANSSALAQVKNASLLPYNIAGYDSTQGSFMWKFNTSVTFDTTLLLTQSQKRARLPIQRDAAVPTNPSWPAWILNMANEIWNRPSNRRATLPSCSPGYYALFDDATSDYICTTCPIGSYCFGSDGLQRLCANGPMGRSVYTTAAWATSSCPFHCTAQGECLSGSSCVVPPTGSMCAQGKVVSCPSTSASPLWAYTSSCIASLQNLGYYQVASGSVPCNGDKSCKFASKPTSNFALFFTLLIGEKPTANTSIDLFYSPFQYKISLSLSTSLRAQISVQLFTALGTVSTSVVAQAFPVTVGQAIDLSLTTSDSNYLMMFANDAPIAYSFFDASSAVASNDGYILTAPYSTTTPILSISNVIFTDLNETLYAQNLRDTPSGLRSLFCDLSSSTLDSTGKCLSLCPAGRVRATLAGDVSICACTSTSNCFDRSFSSSTSCDSGTYFSWSGSYLMVEVVSGSGFMSSLSYIGAGGSQTTFPFCSQIQPSQNLNCEQALVNSTYQGWPLTQGTEAVFYLATTPSKRTSALDPFSSSHSSTSGINYALTRDYQAVTDQFTRFLFKLRSMGYGNSITLNLYFSSSAAQILKKSTSTLIAQNWNIDMIPPSTPYSEEWLETLDPSKATWLAKVSTASTFSPSWTAQSTCLTCPSGSFISLPPLLTIRDCVCSNGMVPDLTMGCQMRPLSSKKSSLALASTATSHANLATCQALMDSVIPSLPSGTYPTATSVGFQSSLRNFTQGFGGSLSSSWDGPIYVELSISVEGQTSLQTVSLLVGESIPLMTSSNMTYTASVPGCSPSSKTILRYEVLPRCSTPSIVIEENSAGAIVSVFGASNTVLYFFVDAPSNTTVVLDNIPWVIYFAPVAISRSSMIYARALSSDGTCSTSSVTSYNINFASPSEPIYSSSDGSASSKCDKRCVAVVASCVVITTVALIVLGTLLLCCFPLKKSERAS